MTMTIDQVLAELGKAKEDAEVYYGFAGLRPTTIASWRGVYAEPALGWDTRAVSAPLVKELMAELRGAIDGKQYAGWKGGTYYYSGDNTLHVDNPGEWTSTEICRIEDRGWCVIFHTESDRI